MERRRCGANVAIVVTHNSSDTIEGCLSALLATTVDLDVIVVDNGSRDDTLTRIRQAFPGVQIVVAGENIGYGAAVNLGARYASVADTLIVSNPDVVCRPGCTEALLDALARHREAALVTPTLLLLDDPSRVNARGNLTHYTGVTTCRGFHELATTCSPADRVAAVSGALFAVRASVFHELGGFDPTFFMYLEDTDLSLRANAAGYQCLHLPGAVACHCFALTISARKLFCLERNRAHMLLKLFGWRTLLAMAPALGLVEAGILAFSVSRGQSYLAAKLSAYGWLVRHLPDVLRSRRAVQARRRVPDRDLLALCGDTLDLQGLEGRQSWVRLVNPFFRAWYFVVLKCSG